VANFNNVETGEHDFTLSASQPRSVNQYDLVLSQPTEITTFTAAQVNGVQFWAFDASETQQFLNGDYLSVPHYLINPSGEYGFIPLTLPAGTWAFGELYNGSLSGPQTIPGFDEESIVTLPGANFIGNVAMAVNGNPGAWFSRDFTITGNPSLYIETEGTGGNFQIMNDAQFQAFEAANPNGYNNGGYTFTYALGGTNGGPSTEVEGQLLLSPGHWNLVWINGTGTWAGGAANISGFTGSGAGSGTLTSTSGPTTPSPPTPPSPGNDLWVTLDDITTNMGFGNPSTTTTAGGYVNLHYTMYNSFATSEPAVVQTYVSTDPIIDTNDTPNVDAPVLGTIFFNAIPANGSMEGTSTLHLPSNLTPGTYYVGVIIDFQNQIAESNENNNASAGMAITVTGPPTFPFTGDPVSQIETIYIGYFGRAGDPDGTNFWTNDLLNGGSTVQFMTGIAASYSVQPESLAQYPFLANPLGATTSGAGNQLDQFINSVYQNLFGRAADGTDTSGGLGFWRGQILNVLATHDPTALANELGSFILQVAYGAQNTAVSQDQTVLANKVTVADFLTQAFAAHNIKFGNDGSAADQFAHTNIASVTADPASVHAAEVAITGIIPSLI
jgi:hypothetical protein